MTKKFNILYNTILLEMPVPAEDLVNVDNKIEEIRNKNINKLKYFGSYFVKNKSIKVYLNYDNDYFLVFSSDDKLDMILSATISTDSNFIVTSTVRKSSDSDLYAIDFYKFLLDNYDFIISDNIQTKSGFNLYKRLFLDPEILFFAFFVDLGIDVAIKTENELNACYGDEKKNIRFKISKK